MSKKPPLKITGYIKRHPDGFGFLVPDDLDFPDVYIAKKHMFDVSMKSAITEIIEKSGS